MSDVEDPYAHLDSERRRRQQWLRRGVVFALIERRGGQVNHQTYEQFVHAAGYRSVAHVSGFLRGDPEPVIQSDGAAAFDRVWLPQLRAGTAQWPTRDAKRLIESSD